MQAEILAVSATDRGCEESRNEKARDVVSMSSD